MVVQNVNTIYIVMLRKFLHSEFIKDSSINELPHKRRAHELISLYYIYSDRKFHFTYSQDSFSARRAGHANLTHTC